MHLYISIAIALIIPILFLIVITRQHALQVDKSLVHLRDNRIKPPSRDLRASAHVDADFATLEPGQEFDDAWPDLKVEFEHGTANPDFRDKRFIEHLYNGMHSQP